ncbi:MAG: STAS domain-containing protein [Phycisphaeraceae bacterium]
MTAKESRLVLNEDESIIQIGFVDRNILEEAIIQQIGDEISAIIEQQTNPRILIDFQGVEHLSSAALGTLITVNNKIRQKGGQLRLADIDPQIYEVFLITKLNKLFQIHETTQKARASFK